MICWKEIVAVRSRVMELERQVNALKALLSVRGIDLVDGWGFCQIISCSFSGKAKIKSLFHLDVQNTNEYYIKSWLGLFFHAFFVLSWFGRDEVRRPWTRCQKRAALCEMVTAPSGHHLIFYSSPCTERTRSGYKMNINCSLTSLYEVKRFFFATINTREQSMSCGYIIFLQIIDIGTFPKFVSVPFRK